MVDSMSSKKSRGQKNQYCCECKELMPKGASKCTHCGSFQNWRRYLSLSSVVLSLLVALISVSTVGISVFRDNIISKYAKLDVVILNQESDLKFQLLIRNAGNAPGLIGNLSRPLIWEDGEYDVVLFPYDPVKREYHDWPLSIPENSFRVMMVAGKLQSAPDYTATKEKFGCKLEFSVIQLSGDEMSHKISCEKIKKPEKGKVWVRKKN